MIAMPLPGTPDHGRRGENVLSVVHLGFPFQEQGSEDHLLQHLGHVLDLLGMFHVLVPVDVGVHLDADQGETEVVQGLLVKSWVSRQMGSTRSGSRLMSSKHATMES